MNRLSRYQRNVGWLGVAQSGFFAGFCLLLAALGVARGEWTDVAVWSPALFLLPMPLVRTRNLLFRIDGLRLLIRGGQFTVLALLAVGALAMGNIGALWDFALPAAWLTLGLTFWLLSHPMVHVERTPWFGPR